MDWVFDNFRIIIIVGGAIAYWLNERRKAKEAAEIDESLSTRPPEEGMDDDAERTRRIQEEIRRKIMERIGGSVPTPMPPPLQPTPPRLREVVAQPVQASQRVEPQPDFYAESLAEEKAAEADLAMLEHQQQLAARLRELQEQRREHASRADVFANATAVSMNASSVAAPGSLLADLRNPMSARRAMVLREVLGTPVSLR